MALIVVLALCSWLGSLLIQIERDMTMARRRVRAVQERELKVVHLIDRMKHEIAGREQEARELEQTTSGLRGQTEQLREAESARNGHNPNRLLVLNTRRHDGDRDWVVTLANPTLARIDPNLPLVQEWAQGRPYLVFAKDEHDAKERTLRRFSTRSGMVVRAVAPLPAGIFGSDSASPGAGRSSSAPSRP
jgi:hypothetical protein